MGWPLRFGAKYREFGGSFIYPMGEDKVSIGFVAGLDYRDATFSVHDVVQEFKLHPKIRKILEGGKRVAWGAKTIPSGGYWAMPKQLWVPGMVLAGDAAGMVNIPKLKGIHLAMHAGMFAAESIYERLQGADCDDLSNYEEKVAGRSSRRTSTARATCARRSARASSSAARWRTRWRSPAGASPAGGSTHDDAIQPVFIGDRNKKYPKPDGKHTFDKLSSVFATGNHRVTTRRTTSASSRRCRSRSRSCGSTCAPRRSTRCPRRSWSKLQKGNGDADAKQSRRPGGALELRAVRRDHRQGRPADAARGRRRPELPADLAAPGVGSRA